MFRRGDKTPPITPSSSLQSFRYEDMGAAPSPDLKLSPLKKEAKEAEKAHKKAVKLAKQEAETADKEAKKEADKAAQDMKKAAKIAAREEARKRGPELGNLVFDPVMAALINDIPPTPPRPKPVHLLLSAVPAEDQLSPRAPTPSTFTVAELINHINNRHVELPPEHNEPVRKQPKLDRSRPIKRTYNPDTRTSIDSGNGVGTKQRVFSFYDGTTMTQDEVEAEAANIKADVAAGVIPDFLVTKPVNWANDECWKKVLGKASKPMGRTLDKMERKKAENGLEPVLEAEEDGEDVPLIDDLDLGDAFVTRSLEGAIPRYSVIDTLEHAEAMVHGLGTHSTTL